MVSPETIAMLLIGAGALAAAVRLALLRRGWLSVALAILSLASGALLYLTLFPPLLPIGGETLVVATAGTPASTRAQPGERLVALPEAPALAGAERVPDLATALRRHTQAQAIRILGRGLTPRDRDGDAGLPVSFTPPAPSRGLIRLDPPADTPAGSVFTLGGKTAGLAGGTAELLDPAGARVDARDIGADGSFTLGSTARAEGVAAFTLRLRGSDKAIVSDTPVPLRTLAPPAPLRAVLIGAPSPDAKYLRRWAEDAGIDLASRLDAGGGVDLGEGEVRLDAASLRETDVVIIDDAALAALGSGGRATLAQAVAGGLGVVVRMTGPASAGARGTWRALGLNVEGGADSVPVALPPLAADAEALTFRRGPGSDDLPDSLNRLDDPVPEFARWDLRTGADFVPAVRDADGGLIAGWQQRGQGRAALWAMADSFALVLAGQPERYEQWWSQTLSAIARGQRLFRPDIPALVQAGERIAVCAIAPGAQAVAPGGGAQALAIDPLAGAKGCAAYRPAEAGGHAIVQKSQAGEARFAFLVLPESALPGIRAREMADDTARWAARQNAPAAARAAPERRGPGWPWLLGWLALSAALWFGERRLRARPAA
ncbi:MAG: carboxypeptidase regulatory-like domain-containing protein [Porphyrobacter sp.]|nr:carboxypeptidase regulatory-like domain-containing protein [Porphyrobacter sp.]